MTSNTPFPNSNDPPLKTRLSTKSSFCKQSFICMRIENYLDINVFALGLAMKQRLRATRKRPICVLIMSNESLAFD